MKIEYKIYEIVTEPFLKRERYKFYEHCDYNLEVLREIDHNDAPNICDLFLSLEEALKAIERNKKDLRGLKLTILPVIEVSNISDDDDD